MNNIKIFESISFGRGWYAPEFVGKNKQIFKWSCGMSEIFVDNKLANISKVVLGVKNLVANIKCYITILGNTFNQENISYTIDKNKNINHIHIPISNTQLH